MILVTGGTGLLGAHLLLELTRSGKAVKALKRPTSNISLVEKTFSWYAQDWQTSFNKIEWTDGDISDPESLTEVLRGVTHVYHSAAMVSFSPQDDPEMMRSNIQGTANLVNACLEAGVKKLCHVSSVAALGGSLNGAEVSEESKWSPSKKSSAYALSKFQSELQVWRGISEGLNAVIVNPSVILGPGNWNQGSPSLIRRVDRGLKFYTKGVTGFVDVRDVAKCMVLLMDSDVSCERFLINSENLPYRGVFTMIADQLGKTPPNWHASRPLLEIAWRLAWLWGKISFTKPALTKNTARSGRNVTNYSNEKIRNAIGYEFISVEQSITDTCKIYREDNQ
jgi:dihydroflavonol-4-reductase